MIETKNISIGKRIKKARENAHMTQNELYLKTNISPTQISSFENGKKSIGIDSLDRICRALNVSLDEIYYGNTTYKNLEKAENIGELLVYFINELVNLDLIFVGQKYNSNVDCIGFTNYEYDLIDLIKELQKLKYNERSFANPQIFREELLNSYINRINKKENDIKERAKLVSK